MRPQKEATFALRVSHRYLLTNCSFHKVKTLTNSYSSRSFAYAKSPSIFARPLDISLREIPTNSLHSNEFAFASPGGGTGIRTPRPLRACRFSRAVPCHSVIPPRGMVESPLSLIKATQSDWLLRLNTGCCTNPRSSYFTAENAEENQKCQWITAITTKPTKGFAQRTIQLR